MQKIYLLIILISTNLMAVELIPFKKENNMAVKLTHSEKDTIYSKNITFEGRPFKLVSLDEWLQGNFLIIATLNSPYKPTIEMIGYDEEMWNNISFLRILKIMIKDHKNVIINVNLNGENQDQIKKQLEEIEKMGYKLNFNYTNQPFINYKVKIIWNIAWQNKTKTLTLYSYPNIYVKPIKTIFRYSEYKN